MKKCIKYIFLLFVVILLSGCELFGKTNPKVTINYNCEGVRDYNCQVLDNKLNCMFILPDCENKYFVGWYDSQDGGNEVNLDADFSSDTIIYARWSNEKVVAVNDNKKNSAKYIVSFNVNGGKGGQKDNIEVKYNEKMPTISQEIPTRSGYIFMGWYDNSNYLNGKQYYTSELKSDKKYDVEKNITLYAGWKESSQIAFSTESNVLLKYDIKYDISFNLNGGAGIEPQNVIATYDKDMPAITTSVPTRSGYIFMGWYDNANYSKGTQYYKNTQKSARKYKVKSNITLYAGWKANTYTITFDLNDGKGGQTGSKKVTYNAALPAISKTKPTRKGYTFIGYYDSKDGGTQYYNSNCVALKNYDVNKSITLYARWESGSVTITPVVVNTQYLVSFNLNGGNGTQNNINVNYNEMMPTLNGSVPTRKGYTFMGWYDNSNYAKGTKYYDDKLNSVIKYNYKQDITLYAGWKANIYTITFDSNGGTGGQTGTKQVIYNGNLPAIIQKAPTNDNIEFLGWYDSKEGGTQYYNKSLEAVKYYDVDKNITLYARWQSYTLSFNLNGGAGLNLNDVSATYNSLVPSITKTIPKRTGYKFMGWYDNSDYTKGKQYYDNKSNSVATLTVKGNVQLYAGWSKETYEITFNLNGGEGNVTPKVTVKYGDKLPNIDQVFPQKEGYIFVGWYDNADYTKGVMYYDEDSVATKTYTNTNNMTLYAGWSKVITIKTYDISFNINSGTGTTPNSVQASYGSTMPSITNNIPTRSGYIFMGWYDNSNYTKGTKYYTDKNASARNFNKNNDITLYAGWKIKLNATCNGSYENGYGLAKLNVDVTSGKVQSYTFIIDGREVQKGSSASYNATNKYTLLINPEVMLIDEQGNEVKVTCQVSHSDYLKYNYEGYFFRTKSAKAKNSSVANPFPGNQTSYYVYMPNNVTKDEKLPLIIALHGGCGKTSSISEHYLRKTLNLRDRPLAGQTDLDPRAIIIAPSGGSCSWESTITEAYDILYAYLKLFNVNYDDVIITGSSQGGYGTLYMTMLEEHVIYVPTKNIALEDVAKIYNTTVTEIINYNNQLGMNMHYSNKSKKIMEAGKKLIIRAKNDNDQRIIFAAAVPFSLAKNASRCKFAPSTIYDKNGGCPKNPFYKIRTPMWILTSEDEPYSNITDFAKELTAYYQKNGHVRYTVLKDLKKLKLSPHHTEIVVFGSTDIIHWMINQTHGKVNVESDIEISRIESQLGGNFKEVWNP